MSSNLTVSSISHRPLTLGGAPQDARQSPLPQPPQGSSGLREHAFDPIPLQYLKPDEEDSDQEGSFEGLAFGHQQKVHSSSFLSAPQEYSSSGFSPKSRYKKALEDKGWLVAAMVLGLMVSYPLILKPACQAGGDLLRRMRGISVPKVQC